MIQTVEAVINERGTVRSLKRIRLPVARRTRVTILEESRPSVPGKTAPVEEWNVPRNDLSLLLRETAARAAASDEDALKVDKLLAAKKQWRAGMFLSLSCQRANSGSKPVADPPLRFRPT